MDNCSDRPGAPPSTPSPVTHTLSVCLCSASSEFSKLHPPGPPGPERPLLHLPAARSWVREQAGRALLAGDCHLRGHDPVFCPLPYPPAPATRWARITTSPMGRPQGNPQETPGRRQSLFQPCSSALTPGFSGTTFLSPGGCWLLGALPSPKGAVLESTGWDSRSKACTLAWEPAGSRPREGALTGRKGSQPPQWAEQPRARGTFAGRGRSRQNAHCVPAPGDGLGCQRGEDRTDEPGALGVGAHRPGGLASTGRTRGQAWSWVLVDGGLRGRGP